MKTRQIKAVSDLGEELKRLRFADPEGPFFIILGTERIFGPLYFADMFIRHLAEQNLPLYGVTSKGASGLSYRRKLSNECFSLLLWRDPISARGKAAQLSCEVKECSLNELQLSVIRDVEHSYKYLIELL